MEILSTLSPHGTFLAETPSSWPWIMVFAVMVVGGLAAFISLKKT